MSDRVEQGTVVRDEQDGSGKRLQRQLERLAALQVEVVGRLVEEEEVRARGHDQGEREPPSLAAGELDNRLVLLLPAGEEEATEQVLRLRPLEAGGLLRAVEHAPGLVELDLVLGEVGGHDSVAESRRARDRLADRQQGLKQRRLARPVRPD